MLQVVQVMDANAIKPGMTEIPQETMIRVWMAYSYMSIVLMGGESVQRSNTSEGRKVFSRCARKCPSRHV